MVEIGVVKGVRDGNGGESGKGRLGDKGGLGWKRR